MIADLQDLCTKRYLQPRTCKERECPFGSFRKKKKLYSRRAAAALSWVVKQNNFVLFLNGPFRGAPG